MDMRCPFLMKLRTILLVFIKKSAIGNASHNCHENLIHPNTYLESESKSLLCGRTEEFWAFLTWLRDTLLWETALRLDLATVERAVFGANFLGLSTKNVRLHVQMQLN